MKLTTMFIFLLCCFSSFAQNIIALKGKIVKEKSQLPIESATIYLITAKDSTVVDYTISDKNGFFKLETQKIPQMVILKISSENYKDFTQKIEKIQENKDLGILQLVEHKILLNEVVVKGMAPPIRIKKDTLEFNAASFKVRPDANVEALIRQLPGAQIDENKKITINGKEVNKILVNGKPFFSEDGQIALQNLPVDMIKKVQVSNTKTKEEEMTKQESSSNNSTINLTLKENKKKGVFGKFMGGYGTDDRYESSGIASYFKDKRRITVILSSNNINATGFSMDDVFDNMGGGRNKSMSGGNNGNLAGITRSSTAGLNYDDEWAKGFSSHTAYNYKNSDNENRNKMSKVEFLPTGNIHTESESVSNQLNERHNVNMEFDYKINEKTRITLTPQLAKGTTMGNYVLQTVSRDENNQLMNENGTKIKAKNDSGSIQNWLGFNRSFDKKGRFLNVSLQNSNSRNDSNSLNNSTTLFYRDGAPDDIRNQNILSKRLSNNYTFNAKYSEPLTDSLSIAFGVMTNLTKTTEDSNTFDFDDSNGKYSDKNEQLSSYFDSKSTQFAPNIALIIRKNKLYMRAKIGTYFIDMDNHSNYLNTNSNLPKSYIFPEGTFNLNYKFSKSKSLYAYYDRQFSLPTAFQLLPVTNLSSPLNTFVGNSDLDIGKINVVNINFANYDVSRHTGLSIYSSFTYKESEIASTSIYDDNGKQKTTYINISGNNNVSLGANWDKTIKKGLHNFKYSLQCNTRYELQRGFTNGELFLAQIESIAPGASISYDYGEFFTVRPSYNFEYRKTNYTNYRIDETSNREHNLKIEATNYIQKKWILGNDFGYNYNSNISGGFKKDFYLWNTSLSYRSKEDKWIFKFKVYDILNQNQSATRSITATSVVDAQNTVLKRYGMFSLAYKFQSFAKKEKPKKH
jgi:hypothetical protein